VAVEDKLVLAADEVAEGECGPVGAGAIGEHLLSLGALAPVIGGGGWVDDQLRSLLGLQRSRCALDPDVLADRQADLRPRKLHDRRLGVRGEVALLVEDGVVGQALLAIDALHRPVGKQGDRVVDHRPAVGRALPGLGEADHGGDPGDLGGKLVDGAAVGLDEVALQVEVLGWVAGNAELREQHQIDPGVAGAADPLANLARIAVDVADGRVDLGEP